MIFINHDFGHFNDFIGSVPARTFAPTSKVSGLSIFPLRVPRISTTSILSNVYLCPFILLEILVIAYNVMAVESRKKPIKTNAIEAKAIFVII